MQRAEGAFVAAYKGESLISEGGPTALAFGKRRLGATVGEGETPEVTAIFVWTSPEDFRLFLSINQQDPNSPFRELIEDMRAGKADELKLSTVQLRDRMRWHQRTGFVAINPSPEQRVLKIENFLAEPQG